eukprot:506616-Amphidinium_carterae.1
MTKSPQKIRIVELSISFLFVWFWSLRAGSQWYNFWFFLVGQLSLVLEASSQGSGMPLVLVRQSGAVSLCASQHIGSGTELADGSNDTIKIQMITDRVKETNSITLRV